MVALFYPESDWELARVCAGNIALADEEDRRVAGHKDEELEIERSE